MNVSTVAHVSESTEASPATEKSASKGGSDAFAILLAHLLAMTNVDASAETAVPMDATASEEGGVPDELLMLIERADGAATESGDAAAVLPVVEAGAETPIQALLRLASTVPSGADASEEATVQAEQAVSETDTVALAQELPEEAVPVGETALDRVEQLVSKASYRVAEAAVRTAGEPDDAAGAPKAKAAKTQGPVVLDLADSMEEGQDPNPVDELARRLALRASLAPQDELVEAMERSAAERPAANHQSVEAVAGQGPEAGATAEARLAGALAGTSRVEAPADVSGSESAAAPPQSARPTLETVADFTVRSVRYQVSQGTKTVTVRLIPESLGELRLDVSTLNDGVHVRLTSQHPMVREALEAQVTGLREALARDGLTVAKVSVSVDSGLGQAWSGDSGRGQALFDHAGSSTPSAAHASQHFDGAEEGEPSAARPPSHDGVLNMLI
ncbi:MAG: hypothetical protein GY851_36635 [bacterium]|nr:hypothetical protein [bacterium]